MFEQLLTKFYAGSRDERTLQLLGIAEAWRTMALDIEDVLSRLERYRQRTTYAAVAGVVGGHYRNVMHDQTKSFRNSFVVNKSTKLPTGYGPTIGIPNYSPTATA